MPGTKKACVAAATALLLLSAATAGARQNEWQQIFLEGPIEAAFPDGSVRILEPSCSGGPEVTGEGIVPANTDYSFFVQRGNPRRLLFMLDGGGACWDAFTCIASAQAGISTYTLTVDETPAELAGEGGIFDTGNPDNPFRSYTKIFIPYCTADIHWGSRDTTYQLRGQAPWTIHHRGADNLLGTLDWLQKNGRRQYGIDFARAREVSIGGASAGGYGANLAFAYVAELVGDNARLNLLSDAAVGVLNEEFFATAIYNPDDPGSESWGVPLSLPSWVPGLDEGLLARGLDYPRSFLPSIFSALAAYKPAAKMASLTSNLDLVQIGFYGLMQRAILDKATFVDWYLSMAAMTAATATLPNYRFFIDDGTFHTFVASDEYFYGVGVNGISVADWVSAMISPGGGAWESLNAGPPSGGTGPQ